MDKENFLMWAGLLIGTGSIKTDSEGNFSKGGYNNGRLFGYRNRNMMDSNIHLMFIKILLLLIYVFFHI